MKDAFLKLFSMMAILFFANCFADCPESAARFISCPKTYIKPDQIDFSENAIFVQIRDMIIQTETIRADAHGIYFENAKDTDCGLMQWKCVKPLREGIPCNTCNWIWESRCSVCWKFR